jgi:hypothetical protein
MATLRNTAIGIFRVNGLSRIKEATRWICRDRDRALLLFATRCDAVQLSVTLPQP